MSLTMSLTWVRGLIMWNANSQKYGKKVLGKTNFPVNKYSNNLR